MPIKLTENNSLIINRPDLAKQWHNRKNGILMPSDVTIGSNQKIWWICDCGYEWQSAPKTRSAYKDSLCPKCRRKESNSKTGKLATKTNEDFLKELKSIYNEEYTPLENYINSSTKILMRHNVCGHEWEVRPNSMTGKQKTGCPKCSYAKSSNEKRRPHDEFNEIIQDRYNNEYTLLSQYETKRKVIKVRHDVCGYEWETVAQNLTQKGVITPCKKCRMEKQRVDEEIILKQIAEKVGDEYTLIGKYEGMQKQVEIKHNKCGHTWFVRMDNFLRNDSRCPNCAIEQSLPEKIICFYLKKIFPDTICQYKPKWLEKQEIDIYIPSIKIGIEYDGHFYHNSHKSLERDIKKSRKIKKHNIHLIRVREVGCHLLDDACEDTILEYTPNKNGYNNLDIIVSKLLKIISTKHNIDETISIDIKRDYFEILEDCKVEKDEKSLQTLFPDISKEWHPTKNGNLTPKNFTPGSEYKVWWLGNCGHEWEAIIGNRTLKNSGCPVCANLIVATGFNDLATFKPELLKEWHPTKNIGIKPENTLATSGKKVWWLGKCGHEWETTVRNRNDGAGCPYCSNNSLLEGFNDLYTKNPKLAKEWHPTKNGCLKPNEVAPNSSKKVWWFGECGHEWEATVSNRNSGAGCHYCSGYKVLTGFNDLATINSELAKEWHPTKNNGLKPSEITANNNKKVWWLGKCGHEWKTSVSIRNSGAGCPYCSNQKILIGFNDLATTNQRLLKEWDYKKNTDIKPTDVTKAAKRKVWWVCENNHSYKTQICSRTKGTGCPECLKEDRDRIWISIFNDYKKLSVNSKNEGLKNTLNKNNRLGKWAYTQRRKCNKGTLEEWKIDNLNAIGFDFSFPSQVTDTTEEK